jgi:hypothetical protein
LLFMFRLATLGSISITPHQTINLTLTDVATSSLTNMYVFYNTQALSLHALYTAWDGISITRLLVFSHTLKIW